MTTTKSGAKSAKMTTTKNGAKSAKMTTTKSGAKSAKMTITKSSAKSAKMTLSGTLADPQGGRRGRALLPWLGKRSVGIPLGRIDSGGSGR